MFYLEKVKIDPCCIQDLPQLLTECFGNTPQISKEKISNLTEKDDPFGNMLLKVDLEIENETYHFVAKKVPHDPLWQEASNVQVTFKNEIAFYGTIVPTLQDFQREQGLTNVIDCFPEFYAARLGLHEHGDRVDENHAVLLMENLTETGYIHMDRLRGFDLDGAEMILRDLAKLHGVPLALKLQDLDTFDRQIKIYCHDYNPITSLSKILREVTMDILKQDPECAKLSSKISHWGTRHFTPPREPFATISHGNLWLNNTMQIYNDGKVTKNKFVDFQFYTYRSAAADVLFFLWTSVQDAVIANHFDRLLKYYHYHLLHNLRECNCSTEAFGYKQFLNELKIEADYEFGHALQFTTFVVYLEKGNEGFGKPPTKETVSKIVTQRAKEKAWFMVKECHKQGWM